MTSVKKRLDHVICQLGELGTEPNDACSRNIIAQLKVVNSAFKETTNSPMCCFRYDAKYRIYCDVAGPLEPEQFMQKCRQCQTEIKQLLSTLKAD